MYNNSVRVLDVYLPHCTVADALKTLDPVLFGKWGHYLGLKAAVYEAYVSPTLCSGVPGFTSSIAGLLFLWQGAVGAGEVWRVHSSVEACSGP